MCTNYRERETRTLLSAQKDFNPLIFVPILKKARCAKIRRNHVCSRSTVVALRAKTVFLRSNKIECVWGEWTKRNSYGLAFLAPYLLFLVGGKLLGVTPTRNISGELTILLQTLTLSLSLSLSLLKLSPRFNPSWVVKNNLLFRISLSHTQRETDRSTPVYHAKDKWG